jgi:hypothetical protein
MHRHDLPGEDEGPGAPATPTLRLDAEGLFFGYHGYGAAGIAPMFPFGHGLGYISWDYESLTGTDGHLPPGLSYPGYPGSPRGDG